VLVRLDKIAAVLPPRGFPAKRLFLRLRTTRFISCSETLLSIATAPYEQNTFSSVHSLWWKRPEEEVIPTLEELDIGFVPYSPLGRGFLAGSITEDTQFLEGDKRGSYPRLFPEARKANRALLDVIAAFAAHRNATTAQIALAWLLAQKPWIVPIPGTTKMERLQENIRATALELTPEELRELDSATAEIAIVGERYRQFQQHVR